MGILTLLRNAFGRSRKARTAEAESAEPTATRESTEPTKTAPEPARPEPATQEPTTPEPTEATDSGHPEPTTATASATQDPTPRIPEPRPALRDTHELVVAAFDHVTVPRPTRPTDQPEEEPLTQETAQPEPTLTEEKSPEEPPAAEAEPAKAQEPAEEEPAAAEEKPAEEPTTAEEEAAEEPAVAEEETAEEPTAAEAAEEPTIAEDKPTEAHEPAEPEPAAAVEEPAEGPTAAEEKPAEEPAVDEDETAEEPAVAEEEPAKEEPVAEEEPAQPADAPEPAAADGEDTPQGPLAPDNESRTGGAGGNETAEGEAEAEPTAPEPAAADGEDAPQGNDTAEGGAEAEAPENDDPAPKPAVPLTRVKATAPTLTTAYKAATAALKKHDLTGTRAKVYLVLDRSASMRPYYKDGSAQALAEQTLALAAHLDPEATLQVVFFSTEVDGTGELTLTDHENKIDELHAGLGRMGRTSYHAAVQQVIDLHGKTQDPTGPALVVFQTDGAPDAKTPATQSLTDAAKNHPALFFSFVAFGEHDNKAFDYLRKLKTENTSFFHAGPTPRELTDKELYEGVLATWRP
ncbi:Toxic cation resistance protein [Streptomyces sp. Ru71]|uniref:VWA domain-containing protein n=1 Tax=Streptomyces sp. Ru71 TaxID=2080746 RepID=UPI000CDE2F76|nr:VWA domain-containing protein [Streptomyces sp. Ru71]POX56785.1 Toxic cation resistance protein [Streptomyces sp. Ru71]